MQVVVLAGGLATRLNNLTEHTPKSMISIEGHPFIAYQLATLRKCGARKVLLCIGHLGDRIKDYVGDGRRFGLAVSYSDEGKSLLGTGGALRNAEPQLENEFSVMYGDSYFQLPIGDIWTRFHALDLPGLMVVLKNQNRYGLSNCAVESDLVTSYSKGGAHPLYEYVDFGFICLRKSALATLPKKTPTDLSVLLSALASKRQLSAYEVHQRFYEVGSVQGLADFTQYVKNTGPDRLLRSESTGRE